MSRYRGMLLDAIERLTPDPKFGAEIGVNAGKTSAMLLRRFPNLTLYSIDPWTKQPKWSDYGADPMATSREATWEKKYLQVLGLLEEFGSRSKVLRQFSSKAFHTIRWDKVELDFAFIDGNHSYKSVLQDAGLYWSICREGGILFFHDYGNGSSHTKRVKEAVDYFASIHAVEVHDIGSYLAYVEKVNLAD